MLKLGNVELGEQPGIAIAIQDAVDPSAITAACPGAIVELRLDALKEATPETCAAFSACYGHFPTLATIRHADEGGAWHGTEAERLDCFKAVIPVVDAVDVEIAVGSITGEVVATAHDAGKLVIGSFHDFDATPDEERLEQVHEAGRKAGVDIVKVAARCNDPEDLRRLAAFTLAHREEGIIVVGMEAYGLVSRVFFPALGSLLSYTFMGTPTAPGQLNCHDTLAYLGGFYPQGVARPRG
ncbi:MAG: type I 3-dehydroquinate dehydratase [Candidatus Hydrogenedentes bacterium]|nr:type I 3-dehydroquinate dehydratase [Candidatus Hydrogenedentota bacterium]